MSRNLTIITHTNICCMDNTSTSSAFDPPIQNISNKMYMYMYIVGDNNLTESGDRVRGLILITSKFLVSLRYRISVVIKV